SILGLVLTNVNPPRREAETLSKCFVPALITSPSAAYSSNLFVSIPRSNSLLNAIAAATAEAALLPSPIPAGTLFSSAISILFLIPKSLDICLTTTPAQLFPTFAGIEEEPSPKTLITICSDCSLCAFIVILSSNASRLNPKTSNPGPKFAVEDGAVAITCLCSIRCHLCFLPPDSQFLIELQINWRSHSNPTQRQL